MKKVKVNTPTGEEKAPSKFQGCLATISVLLGFGTLIYAIYVICSL